MGGFAPHWRLASSKKQFGEVNHHSESQAASVASVSAAKADFEDFTSGGVAADAKSSILPLVRPLRERKSDRAAD